MDEIKYIGNNLKIIIDYPIGSLSNDKSFIYPVNFGYIKADSQKIKTYILGVYKPLKEFNGECLAIIKKNNDDNKLIVVPRKQNYTDEQIEALISFQENNDYIIIRRNTIINDELINLASFLNQTYQSQLNMIKKQIVNIVINNSNDIFLIEHLLDELLNIPTCESERLYNYLCGYLDKFNKESAKYYKLEYKNMWN